MCSCTNNIMPVFGSLTENMLSLFWQLFVYILECHSRRFQLKFEIGRWRYTGRNSYMTVRNIIMLLLWSNLVSNIVEVILLNVDITERNITFFAHIFLRNSKEATYIHFMYLIRCRILASGIVYRLRTSKWPWYAGTVDTHK